MHCWPICVMMVAEQQPSRDVSISCVYPRLFFSLIFCDYRGICVAMLTIGSWLLFYKVVVASVVSVYLVLDMILWLW